MDGMYAGFAGAKACRKKLHPWEHSIYQIQTYHVIPAVEPESIAWGL
jgi:hypothetical protein